MVFNKKILIGILLSAISISLILAAVFFFTSLNLTFDVSEPLTVKYYNGSEYQDCNGTWKNAPNLFKKVDGSTLQLDNVFAGSTYRICFGIENTANVNIPFSVNLTGSGWNDYVNNTVISMPSLIPAGDPVFGYIGNVSGYIDFTIKQDANGTFQGSIQFGRG